MLRWSNAGITPQIIFHLKGTIPRCSYKLNRISANETIEIDGSSHTVVIKSSVTNLKSRGRKKEKTLLPEHNAIPFSHSIP